MNDDKPMECIRCGRCCLADFAAYVKDEDIDRWRRQGRKDILHILEQEHGVWQGDYLFSSVSGETLRSCFFIEHDGTVFSCALHETRPITCRNYEPGSSELCSQFGKKR